MSNNPYAATAALKAILEKSYNPAPQAVPIAFDYPADQTSTDPISDALQDLPDQPVLIVSMSLNQRARFRPIARDLSEHQWMINVDLYLYKAQIIGDPLAASAEKRIRDYYLAMDDLLFQHHTLSGTVDHLGHSRGSYWLDYAAGYINWWDVDYWGINFLIPVTQSYGR